MYVLGRFLSSFTVMLTAGLLFACTIERADVRTPSGEAPEADTALVRSLIETMGDALGAGSLSTLDTIFHDSVTVYEGGGVDVGWPRYRDGHLVPELQALEDRDFRFRSVQVRLSNNTAWATARYDLRAIREGEPLAVQGGATLIFRKLSGRWRLVHLHLSSRPIELDPL